VNHALDFPINSISHGIISVPLAASRMALFLAQDRSGDTTNDLVAGLIHPLAAYPPLSNSDSSNYELDPPYIL
jgi:hypothetical protein